MPVAYLLAKRILCVLYLLKDFVTDSPSCTADIDRAAENIKEHLRTRFIRISSHFIGNAFKTNKFNPLTEAHQLAVEIYIYDMELFGEVFDYIFSDVAAFGNFPKVINSLNNFQDCGCIAKSYCVLYTYVVKEKPFVNAVNELLKIPDLDEDDGTKLNELLKKIKEDDTVPFIKMATEKIRPAIKRNKFGLATYAHQLAVQIHNYDRDLFRKVIYNVFKTTNKYTFSQLKKSLNNFQELSCKVDSYYVLYDDIKIGPNYVSTICDLFKTPDLSEEDRRKLCELLKKITEDYPPDFPNSSMNTRIKDALQAKPIVSPGSLLQVGTQIFNNISKVVDGDQYFATIEESFNNIDDYYSAITSFRLLYNNISAMTNALWIYESAVGQLLEDSDLSEFQQEKLIELSKCMQNFSVEHTRHLSILSDIEDIHKK